MNTTRLAMLTKLAMEMALPIFFCVFVCLSVSFLNDELLFWLILDDKLPDSLSSFIPRQLVFCRNLKRYLE